MSALRSFKEELRVAADRGYIYKVTDTYVKLRRWSLRGNFSTMPNWRIRRIGLRVNGIIAAEARREEHRQVAYEARNIKRNDAFGDAAQAIGLVSN